MKHSKTGFFTITILFAGLFFTLSVISAHCQWASTYGGAGKDYLEAIQQTSDGGYIVAGFTYSFGPGDADAWVLKLRARLPGRRRTGVQDGFLQRYPADSTGAISWRDSPLHFVQPVRCLGLKARIAQEQLPGRRRTGVRVTNMQDPSSRQQMEDISWLDIPLDLRLFRISG